VFVNERGDSVLKSDALVLRSRIRNALAFMRERAF
jgi:hypothetical protein